MPFRHARHTRVVWQYRHAMASPGPVATPSRHLPEQAAPSFTAPLRPDGGEGLSPPTRSISASRRTGGTTHLVLDETITASPRSIRQGARLRGLGRDGCDLPRSRRAADTAERVGDVALDVACLTGTAVLAGPQIPRLVLAVPLQSPPAFFP